LGNDEWVAEDSGQIAQTFFTPVHDLGHL
jgi:hypothetical protein